MLRLYSSARAALCGHGMAAVDERHAATFCARAPRICMRTCWFLHAAAWHAMRRALRTRRQLLAWHGRDRVLRTHSAHAHAYTALYAVHGFTLCAFLYAHAKQNFALLHLDLLRFGRGILPGWRFLAFLRFLTFATLCAHAAHAACASSYLISDIVHR